MSQTSHSDDEAFPPPAFCCFPVMGAGAPQQLKSMARAASNGATATVEGVPSHKDEETEGSKLISPPEPIEKVSFRGEELAEAANLSLEDAEQALRALHRISRKWSDAWSSQANILLFPMNCAMTNAVFEVHWVGHPDKQPRRALLRIYGESTGVLFRREDEIEIFRKMSATGQGPKFLARFPQGRVEEFLNAKALAAEDLRDPQLSRRIARKLREFHGLRMRGPQEPMLWTRLRDWLARAQEVASKKVFREFHLDKLADEITSLQARLGSANIAFCHNDVQHGNIMRDIKDGSLTLIDYEYAGWNPVAFDVANHFCEWAADYDTDASHVLDFSRLPSYEERCRFIEAYLTAAGDSIVSQADIEDMVKEADKFVVASHLLYGLWGIIMAPQGKGCFNYVEYARQRFQQYAKTKGAILKKGLGQIATASKKAL